MSSAIVAKGSQLYSTENIVFNLLKNSNCWIDFSDSSTYTTTGTGNLSLSSVTDKSNDARTITINGTCQFDEATKSMFNLTGTGNYLSVTTGGATVASKTETVFLVVSQANNTATTPSFFGTLTTGARYARFGSGFTYGRVGSTLIGGLNALPAGEVIVLSVVCDNTAISTFYNGRTDSNPGAISFTAAGVTRIGQTNTTNFQIGNLYEIIFFNDAVPDDQRQLIEYYLMKKWKITSTISSPTSVTGCTLWLDGNDASTITYSTGTNISQWADKSGNNYHAVQATAARQPTYDSTTKGVNFLQSSVQFMTSSAPYTGSANSECIYIVFKQTNAANADLIGTTDTARGRQLRTQGSRLVIYNGATLSLSGTQLLNTTNTYIVEFVNITGRCLTNINKAANGTSGKIAFASGTWTQVIGGATTSGAVSYDGQIYEMVIFNRALTGDERLSMMNYLFTKWNINPGPTLFSSFQPYANIPPFLRLPLPIDMLGCSLWLDAADRSTITLSGSNVTQWNDKSGNGRNGTVTGTVGYTTGAINGNNVLSFTGTSSTYIRGSASLTGTQMTSFAVCTLNSASTQFARIISLGIPTAPDYNSASYLAPILRSGTDALMYSFRNSGTTNSLAISYDVPFSACSVYDGATGTFYVNGTGSTAVASTGTFAITTYQIGNSLTEESTSNYYGNIGEIIIFNRYLGKSERQLIEGYLAQKWGLKSYLPSTHIFKTEVALVPRFDLRKFSIVLLADGYNTSTLSLSGSNVVSWTDSLGYSGTSTNFSGTPTYSLSTKLLSFDGATSMRFNTTNANSFFQNVSYMACFAVVSTANTNGVIFASTRTGALRFDARFNAQKLQLYARRLDTDGSSALAGATTIPLNTLMLVGFVADTSTNNDLIIYYNGTQDAISSPFPSTGTTSNTACDFVCIAGRDDLVTHPALNGNIGEVLIFNRILSTPQRQQIEGYLAQKWGLQGSLPSTHPYAKYPPY